jgi:hypothetical protein
MLLYWFVLKLGENRKLITDKFLLFFLLVIFTASRLEESVAAPKLWKLLTSI